MADPQWNKYDSDPEALAWARSKIQPRIDHYRDFERKSANKGDSDHARMWRAVAWSMERDECRAAYADHARAHPRGAAQ